MGRPTSAPLASLSLHTPPVSPAGCAGLCLNSHWVHALTQGTRQCGVVQLAEVARPCCGKGWQAGTLLVGASKGPNSWGKGEVVAGREGEESRADLEESRYWMETGAEFVSLDVTPCSTTLRSEMLLGLLLPPPPLQAAILSRYSHTFLQPQPLKSSLARQVLAQERG